MLAEFGLPLRGSSWRDVEPALREVLNQPTSPSGGWTGRRMGYDGRGEPGLAHRRTEGWAETYDSGIGFLVAQRRPALIEVFGGAKVAGLTPGDGLWDCWQERRD